MTATFLLQFLIGLAINLYLDYIRIGTEQIAESTWNACVHPGEKV